MLSTTHSLASALIVTKVSSPILSFPLIIISHYLMDAVPHWDTGSGLSKGLKSKKRAFYQTLIDLFIAALAVFFLFQLGKSPSPKLLFGFILGISPDLIEAPALFLDCRPFPIKQLEKIHDYFHHSWSLPQGLIPQIVLILAIILLNHFL